MKSRSREFYRERSIIAARIGSILWDLATPDAFVRRRWLAAFVSPRPDCIPPETANKWQTPGRIVNWRRRGRTEKRVKEDLRNYLLHRRGRREGAEAGRKRVKRKTEEGTETIVRTFCYRICMAACSYSRGYCWHFNSYGSESIDHVRSSNNRAGYFPTRHAMIDQDSMILTSVFCITSHATCLSNRRARRIQVSRNFISSIASVNYSASKN